MRWGEPQHTSSAQQVHFEIKLMPEENARTVEFRVWGITHSQGIFQANSEIQCSVPESSENVYLPREKIDIDKSRHKPPKQSHLPSVNENPNAKGRVFHSLYCLPFLPPLPEFRSQWSDFNCLS